MEADGGDVFADTVVIDYRIWIVGVEVIHPYVLITCKQRLTVTPPIAQKFTFSLLICGCNPPAAAIMLLSGVTSSEFTC